MSSGGVKILPLRSNKLGPRISRIFVLRTCVKGDSCRSVRSIAAVLDNTTTYDHWKYWEQSAKLKQQLIEVGEIVWEISHVGFDLRKWRHTLFSREIWVTRPLLLWETIRHWQPGRWNITVQWQIKINGVWAQKRYHFPSSYEHMLWKLCTLGR